MLASPALDDVATHAAVENWLAFQIASHMPRSDPLIERTVAYFRWAGSSYRAHSAAVAAILERINTQRLSRCLALDDHPLHAGWKALTRSGAPDWRRRLEMIFPSTRSQVRSLLAQLAEMPTLRMEIDEQPAQWWQNRLASPPLDLLNAPYFAVAGWALLVALYGDVSLGRVTPEHVWMNEPQGALGWLALIASLPLSIAYIRLLRPKLAERFGPLVRGGNKWAWLIALHTFPVAAAFLGTSPVGVLAVVLLSAVLLGWQDAMLPAAPPPDAVARARRRWPIVSLSLSLILVPGLGRFIPWLLVLTTMIIAWHRGQLTILTALSQLSRWVRTLLIMGVAVASGAVVLLLFSGTTPGDQYSASLMLLSGIRLPLIGTAHAPRPIRSTIWIGLLLAVVTIWAIVGPHPAPR
jgi:hypothetical protein